MQLDHLKYTNCPVCGSLVVSETKEKQHCNTHWNETQVFGCGMRLKWSPNYMGIDTRECRACPNTPEEILKKEERKVAKENVIRYIKKLKVDQDFKDAAISSINSSIWYV